MIGDIASKMRDIMYKQILSLKKRMEYQPQLRRAYELEIKKVIEYEKEISKKSKSAMVL